MELDKINQVDRITLCGYLLNYYSSLQLKALRVCWKLQSKIIKENACIYQYQTNLQYFTALWSSMRWISQILYTKYSRFFKNIKYFLVFRLVRINRLSEIEKKSTRTFIKWIMITKFERNWWKISSFPLLNWYTVDNGSFIVPCVKS